MGHGSVSYALGSRLIFAAGRLRVSWLWADGNIGVIERSTIDDRVARILLDIYLLGDARQSAAAAAELERRAA